MEGLQVLPVAENNDASVDDPVVVTEQPAKKDVKPKGKIRAKHICPVSNCKSSVIHLPRHMRKCHGWSPRKSGGVLNAFNLRKNKMQTTARPKRHYKSKMCPVRDCNSIVKRIHNHIRKVHKVKPGSKTYLKCLENAVPYEAPVLSPSKPTEDGDDSSDLYHPPPKKIKEENYVKNLGTIFQSVYGSDDSDESYDCNRDDASPSKDEDDREDIEEDVIDGDLIENDQQYIQGADHLDNNLPQLFVQFEEWLKGPDGGRKDERCASQCRRQVQLVINFIDPKNPNLSSIFKKKILRDKWLNIFDKEKQPGTVKSYLGALNLFYVFLKCEGVEVDVSPATLSSLSDQAKLWARSYRKLSQDRFWEKRMDDMATMRTPQQVKEFETSIVARSAIKMMGEYDDYEGELPPNQPDYIVVRDYLLTILCINNGSRSGTLANMTLDEFKNVEEDDGCFVAKVKNHKTFTTHGPVHLVFSHTLYKYVQIYIRQFRNKLGGVDKDGKAPVFLAWSKSKMKSSQVGTQIGSCWGKVFGKESSSGGATAFRKAAVSAVHGTNKDLREDLANLMVHNKATADRYYLLKNKGKTAVQTAKELTKIMRTTSSSQKEGGPSSLCGNHQVSESSSLPTTHKSPPRHKWTTEEVSVLKSLFASDIKQKTITLDKVRQKIVKQPLLFNISPTKIRDKIRSYYDTTTLEEPKCNSPILPNETESQSECFRRFGVDLIEAETSKYW